MIWSTRLSELRAAEQRLRGAHMLETTSIMQSVLEEKGVPFEPVRYVEIPPVAHKLGKMVVPYVALDSRGFLIDNVPSFYAVTKRPDTSDIDRVSVLHRSQEAHVVAEDMSLRKGIFTPYARARTEVFVGSLIPDHYRDGYLNDRLAHLEALRQEASSPSVDLRGKQSMILVEELSLGIDALKEHLV